MISSMNSPLFAGSKIYFKYPSQFRNLDEDSKRPARTAARDQLAETEAGLLVHRNSPRTSPTDPTKMFFELKNTSSDRDSMTTVANALKALNYSVTRQVKG